jgi:hypothetical protein
MAGIITSEIGWIILFKRKKWAIIIDLIIVFSSILVVNFYDNIKYKELFFNIAWSIILSILSAYIFALIKHTILWK